jgi:hypothetical protein
MRVRVVDRKAMRRLWGTSEYRVIIREVEISDRCPQCGGPTRRAGRAQLRGERTGPSRAQVDESVWPCRYLRRRTGGGCVYGVEKAVWWPDWTLPHCSRVPLQGKLGRLRVQWVCSTEKQR